MIWKIADSEIKDLMELETTTNPALMPPQVCVCVYVCAVCALVCGDVW